MKSETHACTPGLERQISSSADEENADEVMPKDEHTSMQQAAFIAKAAAAQLLLDERILTASRDAEGGKGRNSQSGPNDGSDVLVSQAGSSCNAKSGASSLQSPGGGIEVGAAVLLQSPSGNEAAGTPDGNGLSGVSSSVQSLDGSLLGTTAVASPKDIQGKKNLAKKRRRTISTLSDKGDPKGKEGNAIKRRKKHSLDSAVGEKLKKKPEACKTGTEKDLSKDTREKRKRTAFSNEKKDILEKHFQKSIYVTKSMVIDISNEVGLDKKKIDNWFRNRRSKLKKDEMDKKLKEAVAVQTKLDSIASVSRNPSEVDSSSGLSSEENSIDVVSETKSTGRKKQSVEKVKEKEEEKEEGRKSEEMCVIEEKSGEKLSEENSVESVPQKKVGGCEGRKKQGDNDGDESLEGEERHNISKPEEPRKGTKLSEEDSIEGVLKKKGGTRRKPSVPMDEETLIGTERTENSVVVDDNNISTVEEAKAHDATGDDAKLIISEESQRPESVKPVVMSDAVIKEGERVAVGERMDLTLPYEDLGEKLSPEKTTKKDADNVVNETVENVPLIMPRDKSDEVASSQLTTLVVFDAVSANPTLDTLDLEDSPSEDDTDYGSLVIAEGSEKGDRDWDTEEEEASTAVRNMVQFDLDEDVASKVGEDLDAEIGNDADMQQLKSPIASARPGYAPRDPQGLYIG